MKLSILFIVFSVCYVLFDMLIKKIDLAGILIKSFRRRRHRRAVSIIVVFAFVFMLEYTKYDLNEKYGHPNYISLVLGALIGAVCINTIPVIYKSKNWRNY